MSEFENVTARRRFIARSTALAGAWLFATRTVSAAVPEYPDLTTPAIAVKTPANILLTAITLTPGNRLVAVGEHGVIIYSDNNGAGWTQAQVPVDLTLTCVRFATAEIGWAVGHFAAILNTRDGGKSWRLQLNGLQVNQLTVAEANAPATITNPSPAAPLASHRAQHLVAGGPDNPFLTMLVYTPQKILVLGAYRMAVLSNDGGTNWLDWDLHIYDKYSHHIYDAAVIGGIAYIVAEEGLMFSSTDGGNTFLPLTSPGGSTLLGVLGTPDGSLVVFGVAGFAARSTDSGKTWKSLTIATEQDLTGGRLLISGAVILVDEAGVVFQSIDNGLTFTRIQGVQPAPFYDVQQAPDRSLIAVGAAGVTRIPESLLA